MVGAQAMSCAWSRGASVVSVGLLGVENAVEGDVVLVFLFHPLYLLPRDVMDISSVEATVAEIRYRLAYVCWTLLLVLGEPLLDFFLVFFLADPLVVATYLSTILQGLLEKVTRTFLWAARPEEVRRMH